MVHSAIVAVFGTAELLEAVLLELNHWTLLTIQRVKKAFHKTISGFKSSQEKLGFRQTIVSRGDRDLNSWGRISSHITCADATSIRSFYSIIEQGDLIIDLAASPAMKRISVRSWLGLGLCM